MAYSKQNFQNGQILNAANLEIMENGIIAGQGAYNLLDNSDFTNPVNSQGKTSWTEWNNYTVDRWIFRNNHVSEASVGVSGMSITTGSSEIYFEQPFDKSAKQFYIGKPLTLVFSTNEGLLIKKWTVVDGSYSREPIGNFQMTIGCLTNFWIDLVVPANKTVNIYWAALYEGSYTAETLPTYVPKGKRVEMLNCGIPPQPRNLLDNSDFRNPVNQRGVSAWNSGIGIDRWYAYNADCSKQDGYVRLAPGANMYQIIPNEAIKLGKPYTIALCFSGNTIICNSGVLPTTTPEGAPELIWVTDGNIRVSLRYESIGYYISIRNFASGGYGVQWAALYEGSYTADTLPAYQPKGYAAELAECQRYFTRVGNSAAYGIISGNRCVVKVPLPTTMREGIVPTVTLDGAAWAYTHEGYVGLTFIGAMYSTNTASLHFTLGTEISARCCVVPDLSFNISADL